MDKSTHLYHYLFLVFGLLASLFFFLYFKNPAYQTVSALAGCVFYSAWGIIHGLLEQRLNKHVAFEYISLSVFVFALLFVSLSLI
ncbi:hypothetical protein COT50_04035 [candidate division WWE3 bacterium CG08_land_8_20_14_0_20_41_10]|uniref:Uncharacterized protein n=1 Tax=candidate division WWE3 bacterium CG08_land_8_20_14_0_20_41_10 TaxID=1975085 RepID=A0A2H0XB61_UNCKA|nr:MAG: hypothetical protein COT50_04035 [candidate division WWE3 bacterium CG08_land_8_20_14_0_20_41_10]